MTLGSTTAKAGSVAAQVISAIASVELPAGQWPELIEILLRFMDNVDNVNLRIATLQTIGYVCESIVRRPSIGSSEHALTVQSTYRNPKF